MVSLPTFWRAAMKTWDELDYKILNLLQTRFPLSVTPFQDIALQLGTTEGEVLNRIALLRKAGIIRRIGGIINSPALGFYSTLCACRAAEDRIMEVGDIISSYPQVSHNYVRDHRQFNIWFTITAESKEKVFELIEKIERQTGTSIVNMPAQKIYKIKVSFEMEPAHEI
jgi:DNA-binding Lrp family transcriptional regulator